MPEEGKDNVEKIVPDAEGKVPADKDGKYPEVVPWSQYVGIKESLGKKLTASEEKVTSLEEKLKNAPNAEEAAKTKEELESTKTKLQEKEEAETKATEKSVTEMREVLKKANVPDEKLEGASEAELKRLIDVLGGVKPKSLPDLSGGGGGSGGVPQGSPMELARQAYESPSKK